MPTSSWACSQPLGRREHAHEDVGMPPGPDTSCAMKKIQQIRTPPAPRGVWSGSPVSGFPISRLPTPGSERFATPHRDSSTVEDELRRAWEGLIATSRRSAGPRWTRRGIRFVRRRHHPGCHRTGAESGSFSAARWSTVDQAPRIAPFPLREMVHGGPPDARGGPRWTRRHGVALPTPRGGPRWTSRGIGFPRRSCRQGCGASWATSTARGRAVAVGLIRLWSAS